MVKKKRKTKRRATRRRSNQPMAGWVWMLFGLAVGLAVAAAIYVNDRSPQGPVAATSPAPPAKPAPAKPAPAPAGPVEERFDFYEMLPSFEVVIPEEDLEARPDVAATPVNKPGPYVLQAGSFSSNEDADRMKARLALLGIISRIQKVSIDDKTFHRVRVGPVSDLTELNRMRSQLREARIEVMVIRVAE